MNEILYSCKKEYRDKQKHIIVVIELCQKQSFKLIILYIIAKYTQMTFDILINTFRLFINKKIKNNQYVDFNT